ncbi:ATP-binding protein [Leucobacter insecticola]|uniref:ATP-binding protein n=1 Tax=Leucobacter insecticola TaxID=2714934 RepID=UPI00197EC3F3|nr:DUF87 domain-containing protein [Leucobacter insecticola]
MQDFGLLDVPYPMRKLSLSPLGELTRVGTGKNGDESYSFKRGVLTFPTVGDPAVLPTVAQLRAIVESGDNRHVKIGTSPLAADANVMIDPDRLFGRHLAVLGNTGSGKSCSVAGLIRWSLEAARKKSGSDPNARFIVLDPNGEYSKTFNDLGARVFSVEPRDGAQQMVVPTWLWNSDEWAAIAQASAATQRPLLKRALRDVRSGLSGGTETAELRSREVRRYLTSQMVLLGRYISENLYKDKATMVGKYMRTVVEDLNYYAEEGDNLSILAGRLGKYLDEQANTLEGGKGEYFRAFKLNDLKYTITCLAEIANEFGGSIATDCVSEDAPLPFRIETLADHFEQLGVEEKVSQFTDFLVTRIRSLISNVQLRQIAGDDMELTLASWLENHFGSETREDSAVITVLDLSLLPAESVHVITAVIARMTLEALQRYRKLNDGAVLPTVLVMEEAHTFIKRRSADGDIQGAQDACSAIFEKIAREGRKFGLGLVLSSQRPSELSPTVLSQCNSFLLHRLSNHTDQDLVQRLVPDNLRGLLRDLPTLPSRNAILLGWASELPVSVEMRMLNQEQRPQSDDPDFWNVWSGKNDNDELVERTVDWKAIADDWQGFANATAHEPDQGQHDSFDAEAVWTGGEDNSGEGSYADE